MSLASEASKLFTNKYFLYFMVFLASTNVLGYLVTNKTNAIIFFALVSLITFQFSKNMSVILLVAVISTNFLMANKRMREGLENQSESTPALQNISDKDEVVAKALPIVENSKTNEEVTNKIKQNGNSNTNGASNNGASNNGASNNGASNNGTTSPDATPSNAIDINNSDLNRTNLPGPAGAGQAIGNKKTSNENFGPRLDYAATIEQSYANLDNLLGSDAIKQLTGDTQRLMQQQQTLFNTMNQMVPVLEGAQNMLNNFNVGGLTDSLKNITGLTAGASDKNKK